MLVPRRAFALRDHTHDGLPYTQYTISQGRAELPWRDRLNHYLNICVLNIYSCRSKLLLFLRAGPGKGRACIRGACVEGVSLLHRLQSTGTTRPDQLRRNCWARYLLALRRLATALASRDSKECFFDVTRKQSFQEDPTGGTQVPNNG